MSEKSLSCKQDSYGIKTDNTSVDVVKFSVSDLENLTAVTAHDFLWTFSENKTELFSSESPGLTIQKRDLVACHTYQAKATFSNCGEEETLMVDYTMDGNDCEPPPSPEEPPPTNFPPAEPAPPGQQSTGTGCSIYGTIPNGGFDYAKAKYCTTDPLPPPGSSTQLMQCRNSGFDVSGVVRYYPIIKAGQYIAVEVTLPRPFTNGISKTLCGFSLEGESGGNPCGGTPAAVEKWTISPNPGDFEVSDPRCVAYTTTTQIRGHARTTPELGYCPMDPGRKYFANIRMGNNCTNPNGCVFMMETRPLYSGRVYTIGGRKYRTNLSCELIPE